MVADAVRNFGQRQRVNLRQPGRGDRPAFHGGRVVLRVARHEGRDEGETQQDGSTGHSATTF